MSISRSRCQVNKGLACGMVQPYQEPFVEVLNIDGSKIVEDAVEHFFRIFELLSGDLQNLQSFLGGVRRLKAI